MFEANMCYIKSLASLSETFIKKKKRNKNNEITRNSSHSNNNKTNKTPRDFWSVSLLTCG